MAKKPAQPDKPGRKTAYSPKTDEIAYEVCRQFGADDRQRIHLRHALQLGAEETMGALVARRLAQRGRGYDSFGLQIVGNIAE